MWDFVNIYITQEVAPNASLVRGITPNKCLTSLGRSPNSQSKDTCLVKSHKPDPYNVRGVCGLTGGEIKLTVILLASTTLHPGDQLTIKWTVGKS